MRETDYFVPFCALEKLIYIKSVLWDFIQKKKEKCKYTLEQKSKDLSWVNDWINIKLQEGAHLLETKVDKLTNFQHAIDYGPCYVKVVYFFGNAEMGMLL